VHLAEWVSMGITWTLVMAGLGVGLVYGVFGVGSAFATPMLSLLGVSGMAAVAGPLPALLPGSAAGAWSYSRGGKVDWAVARLTLVYALPAAVTGAVVSQFVGGPVLLLLSGFVLLVVGFRVIRPGAPIAVELALARRTNLRFMVPAAVAIGFSSGLLANGGGFLLVPLFLLALGLDMNESAGTSLVVASALTVPTLVTHALVGNIDWLISSGFALGLIPGAVLGGQVAQRMPTTKLRGAFGVLLIGFAVWYLIRQVSAIIA
jgi:uncharacterized protein